MIRLFGMVALAVTFLGFTSSANAAFLSFSTPLSGAAESPPNASPATGFSQVDLDTVTHTMRVRVVFASLQGLTTTAHIHAPTPTPGTGVSGVATTTPVFAGFPLGVSSGTFDNTLDMTLDSSYNSSFVTANGGTTATAEAALFAAIIQGRAYMNVHSSAFPGGEIRGFFQPLAVQSLPAPPGVIALGLGLFGLVASRRRAA